MKQLSIIAFSAGSHMVYLPPHKTKEILKKEKKRKRNIFLLRSLVPYKTAKNGQ